MPRKPHFVIIPILLLIACIDKKQQPLPSSKSFAIECENERYLLENPKANIEYSFDTLKSVEGFWKQLGKDKNKTADTLYPFVKLHLDSSSVCDRINICLTGFSDWKNDSRLKYSCFSDNIDTNWLKGFYGRIENSEDTSPARFRSEVSLSFYKDSITDIEAPLKTLAKGYISFQKQRALALFQKELCKLTFHQLDTLKNTVPFRIHLRHTL